MKNRKSKGRVWLRAAIVVLGITPAGVILYAHWVFTWPSTVLADQLAGVGDTLAAGTLVLAIAAGIVALAAYADTLREPNLDAVVTFRFSEPNRARLVLEDGTPGNPRRKLASFQQTEADVVITNLSTFPARNPALRITLVGLFGLKDQLGWATIARTSQAGVISLQWDGGADFMVHGEWTRPLPMLDFAAVEVVVGSTCELRLELVADGFRGEAAVPITFIDRQEWDVSADR